MISTFSSLSEPRLACLGRARRLATRRWNARRHAIALAVTCLVNGPVWAACTDTQGSGNGVLGASAGSNCTGQYSSYNGANTAYVNGDGSVLTLTSPSVTITGGSSAQTLGVGGHNSGSTPATPSSTLISSGNLTVVNNGTGPSRAVYVYGGANASGNRSLLDVRGNLVVSRNRSGATGAAMENVGGHIEVQGTTSITAAGGPDAFRNSGAATGLFHGATDIQVTGNGRGILSSASTGWLHFDGLLTVATTAGVAISVSGGSLDARAGLFVTSTGASAHGLNASAAGASITASGSTLQVSTQGVAAHGLYANAAGASVAVGGSTLSATGPSVLLGAGSVATAGDNAEALYALSAVGSIAIRAAQTGGSITTTGADADGIVAYGSGVAATGVEVIAEQTGGTLVTQGGSSAGNGSSGLVAQLDGAGSVSARQTAGASIQTSGSAGHGMVATSGALSGTVDVSVRQEGSMITTGAGAMGIVAFTRAGVMDIRQGSTGSISTSGSSAHGISATQLGGDVSIVQAGSISVSGAGARGISVSTSGAANVEVSGSVQSSDDAIRLASTGASSVTLVGATLESQLGDAVSAAAVGGGLTLSTSANIRVHTASALAIRGGGGADSLSQTGGAIVGDIDAGQGDDGFAMSGGRLEGSVRMGDGTDAITLSGTADLSALRQLDGGGGSDVLTLNGVSLRGFTAASNDASGNLNQANNTNLTAWESIRLRDGATLKLSGNLFVAAATGQVTLDATSTLDLRGNSPGLFTLHGDVTNAGTLAMNDGATDDVTTITGHYTGVAGSRLVVDANWQNPNTFTTDQLVIQGLASGRTTVSVNGGILGNVVRADQQKIASVPVVQVLQAHADTVFVGTAATTNAGEAQLRKIGNDYFWTLEALDSGSGDTFQILGPAAAGYVLGPLQAQEFGFGLLGTLHQREGERQTWRWDGCARRCGDETPMKWGDAGERPVWGRLSGGRYDVAGKNRLGFSGNTAFAQLGADLLRELDDDGTRRRAGFTLSYGWGQFDQRDAYRAISGVVVPDKHTGRASSKVVSLGAYDTWYAADGSYLDLVAQLSGVRNSYAARDGTRAGHNGLIAGMSAEVGRNIRLGEGHWMLEPQAQLMFQRTDFRDLNDGFRRVDFEALNTLRARLGARLAWNDAISQTPGARTFYATAHLLHEFGSGGSRVQVGRDVLDERLGKTWFELGVGAQYPLAPGVYAYGDLRRQRAISDTQPQFGNGRSVVSAVLGIRASW